MALMVFHMYKNFLFRYMLYKSHLLLLELWDMVDMVDGYCFMGPSGRFYPCCYPWDYIGLLGTGYMQVYNWVELPVQRRLCPIFVKNVGSPNIHEYSVGGRVVNGPPGLGRHTAFQE